MIRKNKNFYKILFCVFFYLLINITGCVSTKNNSSDVTIVLDGGWENNNFVLIIRQNYYLSYYDKLLYGAGSITYDDVSFTLISSIARDGEDIFEFEETVSGRYKLIDDILTISNIRGRYRSLNGNWRRIKDLKPEDYLEIQDEEGSTI